MKEGTLWNERFINQRRILPFWDKQSSVFVHQTSTLPSASCIGRKTHARHSNHRARSTRPWKNDWEVKQVMTFWWNRKESSQIFHWTGLGTTVRVNCSAIVRLRLQTILNNFALNGARKAPSRTSDWETKNRTVMQDFWSNTKSYYFPVRIGNSGEFISHEELS